MTRIRAFRSFGKTSDAWTHAISCYLQSRCGVPPQFQAASAYMFHHFYSFLILFDLAFDLAFHTFRSFPRQNAEAKPASSTASPLSSSFSSPSSPSPLLNGHAAQGCHSWSWAAAARWPSCWALPPGALPASGLTGGPRWTSRRPPRWPRRSPTGAWTWIRSPAMSWS